MNREIHQRSDGKFYLWDGLKWQGPFETAHEAGSVQREPDSVGQGGMHRQLDPGYPAYGCGSLTFWLYHRFGPAIGIPVLACSVGLSWMVWRTSDMVRAIAPQGKTASQHFDGERK